MSEKSTVHDPIEVNNFWWMVLSVYSILSSGFVISTAWEWFLEKPTNIHLDFGNAACLIVALSWVFKAKIVSADRPKTGYEVLGYVMDVWMLFGLLALWHFTIFPIK